VNIVQVFQYGKHEIGGGYYVDMELCDLNLDRYLEGEELPNLKKWSELRKRAVQYGTTSDIFDIVGDIIDGLIFIHGQGEAHRDLTPQNSTTFLNPGNCSSLFFRHESLEDR
jgi:serine/threonine protein kinase